MGFLETDMGFQRWVAVAVAAVAAICASEAEAVAGACWVQRGAHPTQYFWL
jgi:hypothetical protein